MFGIRVRDARGREIPLPSAAAVVEICSSDGKVGRLILGGGSQVTILDPSDQEFRNYCKSLKLEMAETIRLVD